mgnify:CR=1 FL=1
MAQTALSLGIKISPQAIEKRFTEESAQFLLALLEKAFLQVVETGSTATALFCRFSSVIVADSTTITLPDELSSLWSGCGGSCEKNTQSSMKVQASVNLEDGGLQVSIHDGKASDNRAPIQEESVPLATLRVSNLGHFNLQARRHTPGIACETFPYPSWHFGTHGQNLQFHPRKQFEAIRQSFRFLAIREECSTRIFQGHKTYARPFA